MRLGVDSIYEHKPLVGYADPFVAHRGDVVEFYVSSSAPQFRAELVRLIHGDVSVGSPGLKEALVKGAEVNGEHPGRRQYTEIGSYAWIDGPSESLNMVEGLTLQAFVFPTTPSLGRRQAILSKWDESSSTGYALGLDGHGSGCLWIGDGSITWELATQQPLRSRVWYLLTATIDLQSMTARVYQRAVPGPGNRLSFLSPEEGADVLIERRMSIAPGASVGPVMIAAWLDRSSLIDRSTSGGHYNGKIERPSIFSRALRDDEIDEAAQNPLDVNGLLATWDFSKNLTQNGVASLTRMKDQSRNGFHATLVNLPTLAVTGHKWTGDTVDFRHASDEFGAIHFHEDDLDDCRWESPIRYRVPTDLQTGVYALRLRTNHEGSDEEDYVTFIVGGRSAESPNARIALLLPTVTYVTYANDHLAEDYGVLEEAVGSATQFSEEDLARYQHQEYGASCYDVHTDGSGVCYASWRRPLLTVRPKYRSFASVVWLINADLHLIDWLHELGYTVDVITDHDLDEEGVSLLARYRTVLTGTHPEYYSERMHTAISQYVSDGGRLMYLGGNGFYWVTGMRQERRDLVEIRRWGGSETWTANPGDYHLSFTGEQGGIWKHRGRPPQKLVGVGFIAQGLDRSSYYMRRSDGFLSATDWIFEGVEPGEKIGDFGLVLGGAAGVEVDCFDPSLGSPSHAYVVASSQDHSRLLLCVRENSGATQPYPGGDMNPVVRSDIVYFPTPNGGAVFSVGSIAWCGSLSYNNYSNNVSTITANVINRFQSDSPLPE